MNTLLMRRKNGLSQIMLSFFVLILSVGSISTVLAENDLNTQELKILIPLYNYPNWYDDSLLYLWDDVAIAQSEVSITAIINPNNGPDGGPPNDDYQHGLEDLREAGVTILGYVYTSYGDRKIKEVKDDVALYDQYYDLDGIFFDEVANTKNRIGYYRALYRYINRKTDLDHVVLNPGTTTHRKYLIGRKPAGDTAVTFEDTYLKWINSEEPPKWVKRLAPERFAFLTYEAIDGISMKAAIDLATKRNYGYVYVTDDGGDNPWDTLPSYWQEMIDYIKLINSDGTLD